MGTIVAFRVGQNDVDSLSRYFQPTFDSEDLLRVPNYNTITRTLIGGVPTQPFSMATLPPLGTPNQELATALKQLSAAKYGRPKAQVEREIFARLTTKEEPKPAFGAASPLGTNAPSSSPNRMPPTAGMPPANSTQRPPSSGSSFLDEWLSKRRQNPSTPAAKGTSAPANPFAQSPAGAPTVPARQVPTAPPVTAQTTAATTANPNIPPPALTPTRATTATPPPFAQAAPISLSLPNLDEPKTTNSAQPQQPEPAEHNVTSQDISALANQLESTIGGAQTTPKPVEPIKAEESEKPVHKPIAHRDETHVDPDDTIAIDREGHVHID
jgi:hypothetical protein